MVGAGWGDVEGWVNFIMGADETVRDGVQITCLIAYIRLGVFETWFVKIKLVIRLVADNLAPHPLPLPNIPKHGTLTCLAVRPERGLALAPAAGAAAPHVHAFACTHFICIALVHVHVIQANLQKDYMYVDSIVICIFHNSALVSADIWASVTMSMDPAR